MKYRLLKEAALQELMEGDEYLARDLGYEERDDIKILYTFPSGIDFPVCDEHGNRLVKVGVKYARNGRMDTAFGTGLTEREAQRDALDKIYSV